MKNDFGIYLRNTRKNKGLTLKSLSTMSGVSQSYLTNIENGKRGIPTPPILKKLHAPLGVDYGELMSVAGYIDFGDIGLTSNRHITKTSQSVIDLVLTKIETLKIKYPEQSQEINDFEQEFKECVNDSEEPFINSCKLLLRNDESDQPKFAEISDIRELEHLISILIYIFDHDDLTTQLTLYDVIYNGHELTDQDKQRILDMLKILFPEYQNERNEQS